MDWGNRKDILVFLEQKDGKALNGALECLTPARALAPHTGGQVLAVLMGTDNAGAAEKVAPLADGVLAVTGGDYSDGAADAFTWALEQLAAQYEPAAVLAGNTPLGREMTARLCARLGLGSVQDATALTWDGDTPVWTVPLYGGTVLNDVVVDTLPVVATTRSGAFAKPEAGQAGPVTPVELQVPADAVKVKVAQAVKELSEAVNLEEAKGIVAGGRGMGSKGQFALVEELAALAPPPFSIATGVSAGGAPPVPPSRTAGSPGPIRWASRARSWPPPCTSPAACRAPPSTCPA